ncbi:MAG: TraR/DksA C4-type zinc finger protein [bacterium]|nr:TraR/DksA C4-type zinc finger protein [bacterium]
MPLDDSEKEELRGLLETLARELDEGLESAADAARPVELDPPAIGRVSRIDAIQQQKMAEANRAAQQARRQAVRAALARIGEEEFGECRACGEDIGLARLRARPESHTCIDCQTARERA